MGNRRGFSLTDIVEGAEDVSSGCGRHRRHSEDEKEDESVTSDIFGGKS